MEISVAYLGGLRCDVQLENSACCISMGGGDGINPPSLSKNPELKIVVTDDPID